MREIVSGFPSISPLAIASPPAARISAAVCSAGPASTPSPSRAEIVAAATAPSASVGGQLGPAPRGMDRFAHRIDDGSLIVDTSKVVLGPLPVALGQPGLSFRYVKRFGETEVEGLAGLVVEASIDPDQAHRRRDLARNDDSVRTETGAQSRLGRFEG